MNYGTSYNIDQTGDLYLLGQHNVATGQAKYSGGSGTTINAPLNYRKLRLFRGLDNELFFFVRNQDRKIVNLLAMEIHGSLINRHTGSTILRRKLGVVDYDRGLISMIVYNNDIYNEENKQCDLVLTYTNELGLELPLYTDANMRPTYTVEITDDARPIPLKSQIIDTFNTDATDANYKISEVAYGPTYYNKKNGLVTLGVYTTNYSGEFYLQGSTSNNPTSDDWFDIELGVQNFYHSFINFSGIEPFVFQSNIRFFRARWEDAGQGTVDKVVIRL